MTREQAVEFFTQQQQYWNRRDAEALTATHTADGTLLSPLFKTVVGQVAILASYRSLFEIFPDWTYAAEELLVEDDRAVQTFSAAATHIGEFMGIAGSGRKFHINGVRFFKMDGLLIARERRYYDFTGLLIQLGVLRSRPANP